MDAKQLISELESVPATARAAADRLRLYTTIGTEVLPQFRPYLEEAHSYRDFFNALYADDSKKHTTVWAEWAKLERKSWIGRFEPKIALQQIRIKSDGLPVEFGTGVMLAPTGSRDAVANLYVFASGAFNTEAADFITSIGGQFTCAGLDFTGVYGLYKYRGSVILEEWQVEHDPTPSKEQ